MSAKIVSTIFANGQGAIAQLGERLLCKQEVAGSIPAGSTITLTRALLANVFENRAASRSACSLKIRMSDI